MLITDVISEYIFDCEIRKFSPKTIKGYRNDLLYLAKYLDGYDITKIEDIKESLIKSFHDPLSDGFSSVGNDGCAFNQRFLKTIHLKSFFKHISDSGRKESYQFLILSIKQRILPHLP